MVVAEVDHCHEGAPTRSAVERGGVLNEHLVGKSLLFRVCGRLHALDLECVVETMRRLPVEPVAGAPACVRGVSLIRGNPMPVLDLGLVLSKGNDAEMQEEATSARLVIVRVAGRRVALAVDDVLGVHSLPVTSVHALPPLLREAHADVVTAIGRLDAELLVVLGGARLLTDEVARAIDGLGGARG